MEAFFVATGIVTLAEMGDKTQLLSLVLAARFRKLWPILAGIFMASIVNHALAAALGVWLSHTFDAQVVRWVSGAAFIMLALWMLIPDKLDENSIYIPSGWGVFAATTLAVFLAEIGDKTQIVAVILSAQYQSFIWVVLGATLGMLFATAPLVWLGDRLLVYIPLRVVRCACAVVFFVWGVLALAEPELKDLWQSSRVS